LLLSIFYLKVKTTMTATLYTYTTNGITFHMLPVKKGRFWMGDHTSKYDDEAPAH